MVTENALKLANILTENQAHSFFIRILPLSPIEAKKYL
jgi:hypothetical protein